MCQLAPPSCAGADSRTQGLDDEFCEYFAGHLETNNTLTEVNLESNNIGGQLIVPLQSSVRVHLSSLVDPGCSIAACTPIVCFTYSCLVCRRCCTVGVGIKHLAGALLKNRTLRVLKLRNQKNPPSPDSLQDLLKVHTHTSMFTFGVDDSIYLCACCLPACIAAAFTNCLRNCLPMSLSLFCSPRRHRRLVLSSKLYVLCCVLFCRLWS